jgi:hypothetical protein
MPAPIDLAGGRRLLSLHVSDRRSRLTMLASELESRHGPAQAAVGQPEAMIDSAAGKLAKSHGDLSALEPREKKAVVETFWRRGLWTAQAVDVENWLRWAEAEWRPHIAETRICAAMLRNFDPQNPATAIICSWLSSRQDRLWGSFGEFARRWHLAGGASAVEKLGAALAAGELSFLDELARTFRTKVLLEGAGYLVAAIESFARQSSVRTDEKAWAAAGALLDLLGPRGLAGARGPDSLRTAAKVAMVSGLVDWAARLGTASAIGTALELSFRLARDPRETIDDWRDMPENIVAQVEKWLVERTLTAAFQIVEDLETDDPAALQLRKKFWLAYLPHMTRARLLGAQKAQRAAARLGSPYCALNTYLSDHCGLLLELRGENGQRLVVVELNNLAQTMFWPDGHPKLPKFDQIAHDGSLLRANCDALLSHLPADAWPSKFAELIVRHTGIRES